MHGLKTSKTAMLTFSLVDSKITDAFKALLSAYNRTSSTNLEIAVTIEKWTTNMVDQPTTNMAAMTSRKNLSMRLNCYWNSFRRWNVIRNFSPPTMITTAEHYKDNIKTTIDADNNAIQEWIRLRKDAGFYLNFFFKINSSDILSQLETLPFSNKSKRTTFGWTKYQSFH